MPEHDPDDPERAVPAWLTAGGTDDEVLGLLKTGKEAEVFLVERHTVDRSLAATLAHKRYRPAELTKGLLEAEGFTRGTTFTADADYQAGRGFRYSRDARAVKRRSAHGRRVVAARWPRDEWDTLVRAYEAGVTVPYPVEFTGDGTLMEFLGTPDGVGAPRLVSAGLTGDELAEAHRQVMGELAALTRAGVAHADLSPYNLLWWRGRVWMIDFPQAVDLVVNPNGLDLLHRDVVTVCRWFSRRGVACEPEDVFASLLAEAW